MSKVEQDFLNRLPKEDPHVLMKAMKKILEFEDLASVTELDYIQLEVAPDRLRYVHQLYHKSRDQPSFIDDPVVYSEADIFPGGLPDIEDIRIKKRKTEDDKFLFEEGKNPPSTPTVNEQS